MSVKQRDSRGTGLRGISAGPQQTACSPSGSSERASSQCQAVLVCILPSLCRLLSSASDDAVPSHHPSGPTSPAAWHLSCLQSSSSQPPAILSASPTGRLLLKRNVGDHKQVMRSLLVAKLNFMNLQRVMAKENHAGGGQSLGCRISFWRIPSAMV